MLPVCGRARRRPNSPLRVPFGKPSRTIRTISSGSRTATPATSSGHTGNCRVGRRRRPASRIRAAGESPGCAAAKLLVLFMFLWYLRCSTPRFPSGISAMARRAGSADLPLHGGHVPKWLADRMTRLGAVISQAIVHHYGRDELLRRLAHPFWFQSFGAVMGMDWHSSGITTSVIGALKRGLKPLEHELGLHVCGGRGKHSRNTPQELVSIGDRVGFDGAALATASRLVAKVDSAAIQDGFDLYLHGFIVANDGRWVVVQQGMNGVRRQARRYHWLSEGLNSFVDEPHAAIDGHDQGNIINLTDRRAERSRRSQIELLGALSPDRILRELAALEGV